DAVLCRWGAMFLPRLERALDAWLRVTRPGGRFCAAVWGPPEHVPLIALPQSAARDVLGAPPPPPDQPTPFSLALLGSLEEMLRRTGWVNVVQEPFVVTMGFESPKEFMRFVDDCSTTVNGLLAHRSELERTAVWQEVGQRLRPFLDVDRNVVLPNACRIV